MLVGCRRCCGRRGGWKSTPQLDRIDRVVSRTKLISGETTSLNRSTDSGLCDSRSSSCAAERVRIHSRDSSCPANALAQSLTNHLFFWTRQYADNDQRCLRGRGRGTGSRETWPNVWAPSENGVAPAVPDRFAASKEMGLPGSMANLSENSIC
jgi:hypothetical protein